MTQIDITAKLATSDEVPSLCVPIDVTHGEFIAWAKDNGFKGHLIEFLASRNDCLGTTHRAWARLNAMGQTEDFLALDGEIRNRISRGIIGDGAMDAYISWLNARLSPLRR